MLWHTDAVPVHLEWQLTTAQQRALALVAACLLAVAALWWWRSAPVTETAVPTVRLAPVPADEGVVIVDVIGAVRRPGVVRLPHGARVVDAVAAAGGLLPGRAPVVNMARPLVDGEQVAVGGALSARSGRGSMPEADAGRVDLNRASVAQLDALPGIGPVLAQRIVDHRAQHGPFTDVRGLLEVTGIGDAKFADLAASVTV